MLSVSNISKSFGEHVLFSNVTFNIGARDRVAIIGPNGSGKTTLFEILVGNVIPDSGSIAMCKDITIGYTKQEISSLVKDGLLDHVAHASNKISGLEHRIKVLHEGLAEENDAEDSARLLRELGELQYKYETAGGYSVEHEAEVVLSGLGFRASDFSRQLSEFSGGWLMRISLAKLLVLNPDMLLLDEPTNHLDLESCLWFEEYLKSYQGAVFVTSHDRAFLNRIAGKIIAIGKDDVVFFHGTYDEYVEARKQEMEVREATARRQEIKIKKEMRFIERFRYKATKATQVQSRLKALAKIERVVVPRTTKRIHFNFPEPARSGDEVIVLKHIVKSYNGNTVYQDLNLTLKRNDRVALVGLNGAGKTTLLKILAGVLLFNGGERKLGYNVTAAYYAQHQLELLDPENTVLEELQKVAPREPDQQLRSLLGSFLFSGDDVYKKVVVLSGGEKSRLSIAKMLVRPANFLLMDEPTNHLDINSREMLIDALDAYRGTLCFITHDRTVIREIANKIIEIKNGVPIVYNGNYDEYLAWKEKQNIPNQTVPQTPVKAVPKETSPWELQRRRKSAEGELRNNFHKEKEPLIKRIGKVETDLAKLESEFRDLETYLATPESYGDRTELTAKTRRHDELITVIKRATEEWEKLSLEIEVKRQVFEQSQRDMETEYGRPDLKRIA